MKRARRRRRFLEGEGAHALPDSRGVALDIFTYFDLFSLPRFTIRRLRCLYMHTYDTVGTLRFLDGFFFFLFLDEDWGRIPPYLSLPCHLLPGR